MTVVVEDHADAETAPTTPAQIRRALSGLYIRIFVAALSSTIITNACRPSWRTCMPARASTPG
jgi:hypothetical protein